VGFFASEKIRKVLPVVLLLTAALFAGACSDDDKGRQENNPQGGKTKVKEETTSRSTNGLETTGNPRPPEVTLGDDTGGETEVVIRLEGDPETTFSGLCSVGEDQKVLSGQVPKRFEFNPKGQQLSCRIEKQDEKTGDLKVVLVAGETTRSVQQTNAPGGVIKVSYKGE